MLLEGATFIDIGGASSKPGTVEISIDEELARVLPALEEIHKKFPETIISIDTYRSDVAKKAVEAGAAMVNDISGGNLDAKMLKTVGMLGVPYVAMHMLGKPENMQDKPSYNNILTHIRSFFASKIDTAHKAGIHDIIIDPGFGFGKNSKWFAGGQYIMTQSSNFKNSFNPLPNVNYKDSSQLSIGGFFIPDFSSITSYWKRVVLRMGFRHEATGILANNFEIKETGLNFGFGLPLPGYSNLNIGLEYGSRGSNNSSMLEEKFWTIRLGFSLNDRDMK